MLRFRKGVSPELMFLISALLIGFVLMLLFFYLNHVVGKSSTAITVSTGRSEVDWIVGEWVVESVREQKGGPSAMAEDLKSFFKRDGWCGVVFCSGSADVSCRFDMFRSLCPYSEGFVAEHEYRRTVLLTADGGGVRTLNVEGRFEK